jgi:hypothetical protein
MIDSTEEELGMTGSGIFKGEDAEDETTFE